MSRARGNALQNALAKYLQRWWRFAESAGAGRNGRDVLGTPGVWWECKTSSTRLRPTEFVSQANSGADLGEIPIVVWWPPGVGAKRPGQAIAMISLPFVMGLLELAGIAPAPSASSPAPTVSPLPSSSHTPTLPDPSAESYPPTNTPAPAPPSTPNLRVIKGDLS